MFSIARKYAGLVIIFYQIFYQQCESVLLPQSQAGLKRLTSDAAVYPGLKRTGLKLVFSDLGSFEDLVETTKAEGFLKIGLFCVVRGAFILYRKPNYNIDNAEEFKVASGENRCFTPTGIESAQPIGPVSLPKRSSITFFTRKNFASIAHPTAIVATKSFFASIKSSIKSLIIVGTKPWTIVTAKLERYCVKPTDFDEGETYPICMLSDLSATKIKHLGINIIMALPGCEKNMLKSTIIEVNFCSYWGAVPDATDTKPLIDEDSLAGRADGDVCSGGGDEDRLLRDTLYFFKALITDTFDKDIILDFNGVTSIKWKLEILDYIFDIAKLAVPEALISNSYMHQIRELFISELAGAWRRHDPNQPVGNSGGNDEIVVGLLTEYDYRGLLYQTNECLKLMGDDQAKSNWAAWQGITNPNATEEQVWKGLVRNHDYNIVIEMTWVIMNMVGGLCHKLFGYAHNYWALYIHFVVNMYLVPVAEEEWVKPAEIGDINFVLGGDMATQYNKLAIFASLALFAANSIEPFQRPILVAMPGKRK